MGLWGAAQAVAFGLGGFGATVLVDLAKLAVATPLAAYALVFVGEAAALRRLGRAREPIAAPTARARERRHCRRMSRRRSLSRSR